MILTANFRPRIKENTLTRIKRMLIGQGKINVVVNVEVAPPDILGQYERSGGFFAVKLAKLLGVNDKNGDRYLQRQMGSRIYKGELLALRKGIFGKRAITAPTDGILEVYDPNKGELRLRSLPKVVPLTSGVYGIVESINKVTGEIFIKTMGTEVIGVLGAGVERGGILKIMNNASGMVSERQITGQLEGHIIVAGAFIHGESLKKAVECNLSGIISGGLNARDYKAMTGYVNPTLRIGSDPGISILATEGFGSLSIGQDVMEVVKSHNGRYVFLSGNAGRLLLPSVDPDSIMALHKVVLPKVIKPEGAIDISLGEINLGSGVRIIWPPFSGAQGKVVAIDKSLTTLDSGVSTYLLTIDTGKRRIRVPYPNVELI